VVIKEFRGMPECDHNHVTARAIVLLGLSIRFAYLAVGKKNESDEKDSADCQPKYFFAAQESLLNFIQLHTCNSGSARRAIGTSPRTAYLTSPSTPAHALRHRPLLDTPIAPLKVLDNRTGDLVLFVIRQ
jgi:hypothetical protein